ISFVCASGHFALSVRIAVFVPRKDRCCAITSRTYLLAPFTPMMPPATRSDPIVSLNAQSQDWIISSKESGDCLKNCQSSRLKIPPPSGLGRPCYSADQTYFDTVPP